MNKQQFLDEVRARLNGLTEEDKQKALDFYIEAINDRVEDGLTEDQAVSALGTPDEIAEKILMDTPLPKLVKAQFTAQPATESGAAPKEKKGLKAWAIVLIILGFPVWFPILIAVFAVLLSIAITIIAVVIGIIAGVIALAVGGVVAAFASLIAIITGGGFNGFLQLAAALILVGISLLLFIPLKAAGVWLVELAARFAGWVKFKLISRRNKTVE